MTRGKTSTGFAFEINENILTDWRFGELIAEGQAEDVDDMTKMRCLFGMVNLLLGKDGKARLIRHVSERSEDGTVQYDAMSAEITDIFNAAGEQEKKS